MFITVESVIDNCIEFYRFDIRNWHSRNKDVYDFALVLKVMYAYEKFKCSEQNEFFRFGE